eukprot:gene9091-10061_t
MNIEKEGVDCKLYLQKLSLISLKQSKVRKSRKKDQRILESKAWNAYFTALCSPYVTSTVHHNLMKPQLVHEDNEFKIFDDLLEESFYLKVTGKIKQAQKIEVLAESLKNKDKFFDAKVVRFLLALAWSQEDSSFSSLNFPTYDCVMPQMTDNLELSLKRSSFCDYSQDNLSERFFNKEVAIGQLEAKRSVFEDKPGTHFENKSSKFAWKMPEQKSEGIELFGALTQSNSTSVDMNLELPDIDSNLLSSSCSFLSQKLSKEPSVDEGFVDESSIASLNETEQTVDFYDNLKIWTDVSKLKLNTLHTWESQQGHDTRQDNSFLTEFGDAAFDYLYRVRRYEVALLTNSKMSRDIRLSREDILRRSLDVLLGLSSNMYSFNKVKCCFNICYQVGCAGLSNEALRGFGRSFCKIGSFYKQISKFIDHHSENRSGLSGGVTLQAFVNSLHTYMDVYRTIIMKLREQPYVSMIMLWNFLRKIEQQLKFLADICLCSIAFGRNKNDPKPKFPTGLKLLAYIHNICERNRNTPHYPLLLHIYQSTAAPFLRSVSDWIFAGSYSDLNAEFFVEINDHYLAYRDKHYWTHGFREKQNKCDLSMFDNDLLEQIFACGKTINLLKKTCPEHYLLRNHLRLPAINIKLSLKDLNNFQLQCDEYTREVQAAYEAERRNMEIQMLEEKERKRNALIAEQNIARKALEKITELENQVKLAIQQKKENELIFLKKQMLAAIEERKKAKEEQLEKDKEFIRIAEVMGEEERERLKKERQELISYYEHLSLMATKREDRALWTVRRLELRTKRNEFLRQENSNIQQAFTEWKNKEIVNETAESLKDTLAISNTIDNKEERKMAEENTRDEEMSKTTLDEMIGDFATGSHSEEKRKRQEGNLLEDGIKESDINIEIAVNKDDLKLQELLDANRHDDKIKFAQQAEGKETKSLMYYNEELKTEKLEKKSIEKDKRFWDITKAEIHKEESIMQNILYPEKYEKEEQKKFVTTRGKEPEAKIKKLIYHQESLVEENIVEDFSAVSGLPIEDVWLDSIAEPFENNFDIMNDLPNPDISSSLNKMKIFEDNEIDETDAVYNLPIEVILQRSLHTAIQSQIFVVQNAVVKYFFDQLRIGIHFIAFRKYLLLEDGEFGHSLCNQLFDKAFVGVSPKEFCIPTVLNNMISRAMQLSLFADKIIFSRQFTFSLKSLPDVFKTTDIAALDFLELRYKVPWPCNIVITENCISKYNKVFSFLLRLKKVNWALQGIWSNLKKADRNRRLSSQLRMLQLFRHEMRHFVINVERYIVNQVIHISWQEFQEDLSDKVYGIDDLHSIHVNYLNKIIFRSLLTKKAGPVFKIISDIFSLILKMHVQVLSSPWQHNEHGTTHPNFKSMCLTYNAFQEYVGFLFKVISKLVRRGYQQHLADFLLQVNFNGYYEAATS